MRDGRPDSYTFEIFVYALAGLAVIGIFSIGYTVFKWIF